MILLDPYRFVTGPVNVLDATLQGADGGTTWTDRSPLARAITRVGTPITSTDQGIGGSSSTKFVSANNDRLTLNGSAATVLPGDFTIEVFGYWTANPSANTAVWASGNWELYRRPASSHALVWYDGSVNRIIGGTPISNGAWHHLCVTRTGTTIRLFLDGVSQGSYTSGVTVGSTGAGVDQIGAWVGGERMNGYLAHIRVRRGENLYPGAGPFTPPSPPF